MTIKKLVKNLTCQDRSSQSGVKDFFMKEFMVLTINHDTEDPVIFPPQVVMEIKALACQPPKEYGLPYSRFSSNDIAREAVKQGIVASISGTTV